MSFTSTEQETNTSIQKGHLSPVIQTPSGNLGYQEKKEDFSFDLSDLFTNEKQKPKHQVIPTKNGTFEIKERFIDEIYYEPQSVSPELRNAIRLLKEANTYSEQALDNFQRGNAFEADDVIQHLQVLLPELFCCRSLNESFGSIVNAIQHGLNNKNGLPLEEKELLSLKSIVQHVYREPFMSFEKAVKVIMDFEDAGFVVEPKGFDELVTIFNE